MAVILFINMTDKFFKIFKKIIPTKLHWVFENYGFKRYFVNTGWMFFGKVFTLGVSFIMLIYIARYLGPANYGLFNYVISFVGLFSFLVSFGIDNVINREMIKNHTKKDELIGTAFYIKIIGSILAIISIFIVSFLTTKDPFILALIWLFSLNFIPQAFNIIEIYFQSQVLSKKVVSAQIISNIISAMLKIICIILGKGIFWLMVISIVETLTYAFVLLFSYRKFGNHIRKWSLNIGLAGNLLKDSWPLMLASISIGIYMKIDQIMIRNMLGNEQTGIYAVVVRISESWYFIPMLICTSLFPAIVNAMSTDIILFKSRMKKLYFLMFWISISIAFITTILAYPIIKILFGVLYLDAVIVLQIYIWAGISVSLGVAVNQYLLSNNFTKISLYNTSLGAIINVILNIILIPRFGIKGAAFTTLVSYTISTFGILIFKKTRDQGLLIIKSITSFR